MDLLQGVLSEEELAEIAGKAHDLGKDTVEAWFGIHPVLAIVYNDREGYEPVEVQLLRLDRGELEARTTDEWYQVDVTLQGRTGPLEEVSHLLNGRYLEGS